MGCHSGGLFLQASVNELVQLEVPESKNNKNTVHKAKTWLAKHGAAKWVRDMNYTGVAPLPAEIMDKFRMLAPVNNLEEPAHSARSVKKMAQRMRKQLHMRIGSLQVQDPISDAEIQKKARTAPVCLHYLAIAVHDY